MILKPFILGGKVNQDGKTNIKIHFSFKGKRRELSTDFYVEPKYFKKGAVTSKIEGYEYINIEIKKRILELEIKLTRVNYKDWTVDQVTSYLKDQKKELDEFYPFMQRFIEYKTKINERTAEIYQATLNKIKAFEKRPNLHFSEITVMWLRRLENNMILSGLELNSRSIHFRNIRTIFNAAIDDELIPITSYPFRRFKIKFGTTEQKGLSLEKLKKIKNYKPEFPGIALVRDAWLFSFYLIGINNADAYALKTIDSEGRINYKRKKTGKEYSIKAEPEALEIISRYKGKKRLLRYSEIYSTSVNFNSSLNQVLKTIGKDVGIDGLTMYHARHTWATLASNELNASDDEVGEALGHSKKTVTTGYINRNPEKVDILNRKVLDLLK